MKISEAGTQRTATRGQSDGCHSSVFLKLCPNVTSSSAPMLRSFPLNSCTRTFLTGRQNVLPSSRCTSARSPRFILPIIRLSPARRVFGLKQFGPPPPPGGGPPGDPPGGPPGEPPGAAPLAIGDCGELDARPAVPNRPETAIPLVNARIMFG